MRCYILWCFQWLIPAAISHIRVRFHVSVYIFTNRQTEDVFGRRKRKTKLPCVMTDDLRKQKNKTKTVIYRTRWNVNASAAFGARNSLTCLSISRNAYLMLGSSKVMAGLLLEKKSLKMRLMMPSNPPRISCEMKVKSGRMTQTTIS